MTSTTSRPAARCRAWLGCGALLFAWVVARAAAPAAPLLDLGPVPAVDPAWARTTERQLAQFRQAAGWTLLVRCSARSPAPEEDRVPGAYMQALATRLGVAEQGVLAVYFDDEAEWRLWIGTQRAPAFVGQPGTAEEFTRSGALHRAKEAFLATVQAAAESAAAARLKTAPAGRGPPPGWRRQDQTDALIAGLIARLGAP